MSWTRPACAAEASNIHKPAFFCSSLVKSSQHGCTVRSSNWKPNKSTSTSVHTLIEAPNEAFRWKIFAPFLVSGQLASLLRFPLTLGNLWSCSKHLGGERKWPQPLRVWHFSDFPLMIRAQAVSIYIIFALTEHICELSLLTHIYFELFHCSRFCCDLEKYLSVANLLVIGFVSPVAITLCHHFLF